MRFGRLFLQGAALLACAVQVLGGLPTAYNQVAKVAPNPCRAEITYTITETTLFGLPFYDPNSSTNPTFTLVRGPTNGMLEYRSDDVNGRFLSVPVNTPISNDTIRYQPVNNSSTFNNNKWSYTCTNSAMTAMGSIDTFTWKIANTDGESGVATCTIRLTNNSPPIANDIYRACAPGTDTTFAVEFYDRDAQWRNSSAPCAQIWCAAIVSPPAFGAITTNGLFLTYTHNPAFTQTVDHFTYKVNDSLEDSNIATGTIQIRNAGERASNLVILVVNDVLLSTTFTNEIYRLKSDLDHEGYATKVKSWHMTGSTSSNLWAYLAAEYTNTSQFLIGTILIGDLPRASVLNGAATEYTDLVYWNLKNFQTQATNNPLRSIWASRIAWPGSTYGDEITLLRRALDANHDYRTGASRLPHKAFLYGTANKSLGYTDSNAVARLREVWPDVDSRGGPSGTNKWFLPDRTDLRVYEGYDAVGGDCLVAGGEFFAETSDGVVGSILQSDGLMSNDALFHFINQVRFHVLWSCDCGAYGGFANNMIFTRGGGCVLAVALTHTGGGGMVGTELFISECSMEDTYFRQLLKAGESMGTAALQYFAFKGIINDRTMFYGDLSLGAMAAPSNSLPVIRSFTNSIPPGHQPVIVNFAVDAIDPDGTVSNIEWFLNGYDCGRMSPTLSGTATNVSFAFPTAGVYTTRVEVIDNYKARTWREAVVTVTASSTCTVTVVKSGNGGSSLGIASPATQMIPVGTATQIVFTAADWYRLQTLTTNGTTVGAAGGTKVYTQALGSVIADISNTVIFALATPSQTGHTNTPTAWLTNWNELAVISDPAFDVYGKYLLGLDPTTSNTFALEIESFAISGSNAVTVLKRTFTGGLSPDGMHGQLELQATDDLNSAFTNIAGTAVTGMTVFDGTGRKTYTNTTVGAGHFMRAVIR